LLLGAGSIDIFTNDILFVFQGLLETGEDGIITSDPMPSSPDDDDDDDDDKG
jgi:hypothetical protein